MSVNISISNTKQSDCQHILEKFIKHGIDSRIIETKSTIKGKVENGCLITLGPPHNDKQKNKRNMEYNRQRLHLCSSKF